jgi:imidazole glycerol-phosphate synthase subunit HisF
MLAKRIIPCLDVDYTQGRARVIKGVKFFDHVDAGDPVEQAVFYDRASADEIVFYDITASHQGRGIMAEVVRAVADRVFMPITVGGGIRELADATALITSGAEKVSVNSAAVKRPELISEIAEKFGTCATVLGCDANRVRYRNLNQIKDLRGPSALIPRAHGADMNGPFFEVWEVFINGGRVPTGIDVLWWAQEAQRRGTGEIVLNVMNADGTKAGYDLEMTAAVSSAVSVPVVASGGAGSPEDMLKVLTEGKADAALAASIFHFREHSVGAVKRYLADHGVNVRLD